MEDEVRQFVIDSLQAMNYDVSEVTGDTIWAPPGWTWSRWPSPSWRSRSRTSSA